MNREALIKTIALLYAILAVSTSFGVGFLFGAGFGFLVWGAWAFVTLIFCMLAKQSGGLE